MNIVFYGNGSAGNHGCEAIVRGTVSELSDFKNQYLVLSQNPQEDTRYKLDALASVIPEKTGYKKDISFLKAYAALKLQHDYTKMDGLAYQNSIKQAAAFGNIAFSVGGDNYCYGGEGIYALLNKAFIKSGVKTVLWGCSIEPDVVAKASVTADLKNYALIVARESITYHAVKDAGANVVQAPDPAFFMKPETCELDARVKAAPAIGINISPMIISCEKEAGAAYQNYKQLLHYILESTDRNILLIPHVVWASNDDRTVLKKLYEDFGHNERIILIEDHCAPELKYIISQCEFFVGARTHATIAAYSTGVPTLVVGYSVKAKGIARDLFGTEQDYVLPVQSLKNENDLLHAFLKLYQNRTEIAAHLKSILPDYLRKAQNAVAALEQLNK